MFISYAGAQVAYNRIVDWLGAAELSRCVAIYSQPEYTVVSVRGEDCDFLEICAVLSDEFDIDRTEHLESGVMSGYVSNHLVSVYPAGLRAFVRSCPNHSEE
jgi:hypothetical protein